MEATKTGEAGTLADNLKIESLVISGFRGIPGKLVIDFKSPNGKGVSMILAGDNGSGKSSIVDAIEFALQARIGRTQYFKGLSKPYPISFHAQATANVQVILSGGYGVMRQIALENDGRFSKPGKRDPHFALSPLVIRRADILNFWSTPDESRQALFFEYFPSQITTEADDEALDSGEGRHLREELLKVKSERRDIANRIAGLLRVDPDSVPVGQNDFEAFAREAVFKGLSSEQRERLAAKGMRVYLDTKLLQEVKLHRKANELYTKLKKRMAAIKPKATNAHIEKARTTGEAMERIGAFVTEAFRRISPSSEFIDRIDLVTGQISPASLSFEVRLKNGASVTPPQIFSEANLDLLALLVFLGVAKDAASKGQARVLILDDIFQSVDAGIRSQALDVVIGELTDWQIVITVHDRLWREEVKHLMRRKGLQILDREILKWDFAEGPRLKATGSQPQEGLRQVLTDGQPYQVCAEAGMLLEQLSNVMSYSMSISVKRKKDDRYTLSDLWPGVAKACRKTTAGTLAEEVDRWWHLRNLAGAHFNEWARSLSIEEARQFGMAVLALFQHLYCDHCNGWVAEVTSAEGASFGFACRCGGTLVNKA